MTIFSRLSSLATTLDKTDTSSCSSFRPCMDLHGVSFMLSVVSSMVRSILFLLQWTSTPVLDLLFLFFSVALSPPCFPTLWRSGLVIPKQPHLWRQVGTTTHTSEYHLTSLHCQQQSQLTFNVLEEVCCGVFPYQLPSCFCRVRSPNDIIVVSACFLTSKSSKHEHSSG